MTITFLIAFTVTNFAAVGLAKLYLELIREGQLLDFMNKPLKWAKEQKNNFIYKSIGGCKICTIQRFLDLSFILVWIMASDMKWYYAFIFYCLYGGMGYNFAVLTDEKKPAPIVKSEKIEINAS